MCKVIITHDKGKGNLMKKFLSILMLSTIMTGSTVALADDDMHAPSLPNTPAVQYLKRIGAHLAYVNTEAGLPGYVSEINGHRTIIYLLPDGKNFFVGSIMDNNGTNLTLKSANEEEEKLTSALRQLKEKAEASASDFGSVSSNPSPSPISNNPLPTTPAPQGLKSEAPVAPQAITTPADSTPINQDVSTNYINSKISASELLADVKKTAYFEEYNNNESAPAVYLVADPACPFCHIAWGMLNDLMKTHNFSVHVILSNALPGSEALVNQLFANSDIVNVWNSGAGSKDGVAIPNVAKVGSQEWNSADAFRLKNNMFAEKYRSLTTSGSKNGVPIIMYVGVDGKVRAEQGVYVGKDRLDAMKAFLSGLPGWKAI